LLGRVDRGAASLFLLDAERGHALHQLGDAAGLAGELRLRVFEFRGRARLGKGLPRALDDGIQIVCSHRRNKGQQTKTGLVPPALALSLVIAPKRLCSARGEIQAASLALT